MPFSKTIMRHSKTEGAARGRTGAAQVFTPAPMPAVELWYTEVIGDPERLNFQAGNTRSQSISAKAKAVILEWPPFYVSLASDRNGGREGYTRYGI